MSLRLIFDLQILQLVWVGRCLIKSVLLLIIISLINMVDDEMVRLSSNYRGFANVLRVQGNLLLIRIVHEGLFLPQGYFSHFPASNNWVCVPVT